MKRAALLAAGALAIAATAAIAAAACSDAVSHVLQGRAYIEGRDCLGTASSIDVVSGTDPGTCAPACIVQTTFEGGRQVYVTITCPPYPPDYDLSGKDPSCAPALAAFARDDTCIADGGSTHPVAPPDAGPPADAGAD